MSLLVSGNNTKIHSSHVFNIMLNCDEHAQYVMFLNIFTWFKLGRGICYTMGKQP